VNILTRKLQGWGKLSAPDREVLDKVIAQSFTVDPHQDLIEEGQQPNNVRLILDGLACRYKLLRDGRRQIFAYLVPGDFCDLHTFDDGSLDRTVSRCEVVEIPRKTILDLTENHPRISQALMWVTLVDEGTLREWIVNIGQRSARESLAHLLCELLVRLEAVGLVQGGEYDLPLTQAELGDTLGLSVVHVNRVLKHLARKAWSQWPNGLYAFLM